MGKVLVKWKPVPQTQQPKTEVENPGVDPGCDFPLSVCVSKFIFPWFLLHWSTVRVWKYASLLWASVTSDISPSLWLLGLITSAASLNPEQKLSDTLYALFTHTDGYAEGSCTLVSGVMCSSSWHDQTRLKTGSWFAGISLFTEIVFVFYCFPVGFHRPQLPINSRALRFKKRAWEDSSHCFFTTVCVSCIFPFHQWIAPLYMVFTQDTQDSTPVCDMSGLCLHHTSAASKWPKWFSWSLYHCFADRVFVL